MVVTCISAWPSSARKPPDRPTAASLAQLYGNRCGTRTMPPTEVIFPIRPLRRARICGRTARGGYSTPQTSRPGLPRNLPWLWAWAQPGLFPHYSRNHARMPHCLRWGGMASLLGGLGDRFPQHNRDLPSKAPPLAAGVFSIAAFYVLVQWHGFPAPCVGFCPPLLGWVLFLKSQK